MLQRILAPTDGSAESEKALPLAERIALAQGAEVLLVRRSTEPSNRLQSAMVLLDGSHFGESALTMTGELAGKPLRSIKLFRVVADPADRAPAESYLQGAARQFAASGAEVTTAID